MEHRRDAGGREEDGVDLFEDVKVSDHGTRSHGCRRRRKAVDSTRKMARGIGGKKWQVSNGKLRTILKIGRLSTSDNFGSVDQRWIVMMPNANPEARLQLRYDTIITDPR